MNERAEHIVLRANIVGALRAWLSAEGFVEVDTPVFISAPAPERFINAVPIEMAAFGRPGRQVRFVQTSPELAMKQVLALGLPRIFQVAAVLRDGDFGPHHRPEFRLLEWYRSNETFQAGMADCEQMLRIALDVARQSLACRERMAPELAAVADGQPIERITFAAAAKRFAGVDERALASAPRLAEALAARGLHLAPDDSHGELCHRLYVDRIEPGLATEGRPVFLTHFPRPLASFAAMAQQRPEAAERFELYACGLELANGFTELTERATYEQRFAEEQALRRLDGNLVYPVPKAFLDSVPAMPAAMGVALGLERLLMVALGRFDIDLVGTLPIADT